MGVVRRLAERIEQAAQLEQAARNEQAARMRALQAARNEKAARNEPVARNRNNEARMRAVQAAREQPALSKQATHNRLVEDERARSDTAKQKLAIEAKLRQKQPSWQKQTERRPPHSNFFTQSFNRIMSLRALQQQLNALDQERWFEENKRHIASMKHSMHALVSKYPINNVALAEYTLPLQRRPFA